MFWGELLKITRRTQLGYPVDQASSLHGWQLRPPDFIHRSSSLHDRIHDLRGTPVNSPPRSQTTPDPITWINTSPLITHQAGDDDESRPSPADTPSSAPGTALAQARPRHPTTPRLTPSHLVAPAARASPFALLRRTSRLRSWFVRLASYARIIRPTAPGPPGIPTSRG